VIIGRERLPVEPWERDVLDGWSDSNEEFGAPAQLVMEALACMTKTLNDMQQLNRSAPDMLYKCQAELMLDTAIGMALLRELQQSIDRSVAGGTMDEAREWTSLKQRLRRTVSRAMQRVGESEHRRVQTLADSLTDVAAPRGRDEEGSVDIPAPRPAQRTHRRNTTARKPTLDKPSTRLVASRPVRQPTGFPGRTWKLAVALLVSLGLWVGIVWLPRQVRVESPVVELAEFGDPAIFTDAVVRPPSLFLQVDANAWGDLGNAGRWQTVKSASEVVEPLGYDGLLMRDESSRPVGQWLRGRGIQVLDTPTPPIVVASRPDDG
jgi:hypothetical protein